MPVNSSSIPALVTAAKVRRRRRKKRASGGGIFDWSGVSEALPEDIGKERIPDPIYHVAKGALWDLPHRAIDAAKGTSYGLRREDFTDVPPDYSPDPNSPLGSIGVAVPKGAWQPTDELIGASLEGAMNTMGGTALSAPAKAAGEMVVGAGPRDPALWHGISKVRLPKPISEMSAVHVPTQQAAERVISPASMQGGKLLPLLGDRTRSGSNLMQVNGYRFTDPVPMQGGHGFMAANEGTGAAWASGKPVTVGLANKVAREGADAPVYGVYTAMGERSGDFSHHVSDTLTEMLQHTKISKTARRSFDDEMRAVDPEWPGLKSEGLRDHLIKSPGAIRKEFAELMDTAKYQKEGFPSVAEARFATTDPRLLNAQTGDSGLSIAKLEGRTFQSPEGQHLSYDTNLAGQYHGGLPTSIPKEVMYPDIVRALEQYRDKLPGYKPTIDYLMSRSLKGLPITQKADQRWVDAVSQHLEKKGFTLGAGATDRKAAALAAVDDIINQEKQLAGAWWHGSPSGDLRGGPSGLHLGTKDAAKQALESRIGVPADGRGWTGDRPYGETLLAGRDTLRKLGVQETGYNARLPEHDFYPKDHSYRAQYGDGTEVPFDAKPILAPYQLTGEMSNARHLPHEDFRANGYMKGQLKRGTAKKGYYYKNVGEDAGSTSITVPGPSHVKPITFGAGAADKRAASLAAVDDILDAERRLTGAANEPANISAAERAAVPGEPAAALDPGAVGPGGGGSSGVRSLPEAQAAAARWASGRPTLEGQQGPLKIGEDYFVPGPIGKIHDVAEDYMRTVHPDRPYTPPTKYHPIDPEHSKAIAQAYEDMKHTPNDPATKASYDALIDETAKQYQAIKATGLKIEPIPAGMPDPYAANPRLAARDVAENNHLWFFPTEGGFGTVNKITDNPMLRKTGEKIGDHELLANDMFRVVHDYFGHLKQGHGFRAAGEDNAWRTHAQMYSDLARPAMTTETRGQNSWVNYGPHGEKNRTASGTDTVYADQKVGLMPEWTMRDRGSPDPIIAYHGSPYSFDRFSMDKIGAGEGNQAYGHGLYFAGHSPVSEFYRYQLAARRDPLLRKYGLDTQDGANVGIELASTKGDPAPLIESYRKYVDDLRAEGRKDLATRNMIQRAENKIAYLSDPERANGHMYEVAIDARPEQFLDWDKPLAEQGEVGKRMMEIPEVAKQQEHQTKFLGPDKGLTGQSAYAAATKWKRGAELSPSADATSRVTEALKKAGVAGIKYLDQFSRGMGGSHNYVAFDDNMVKILRKYGIVGIPAAGVLGVDGEERRATGGAVTAALDLARKIKRKKGGRVHIGPIVGDTGGRADKVPMKVPDGAYVIPADIVSGLGEGNTGAGMVQLSKMFPKSKPSIMRDSPGAVPILAADGEFVVSPDSILDRWDDLAYGHQALDAWVLHERQQLIETLEGLEGPAQD